MEYTSRLGDSPTEAHVNYECPCGCIAGLMYDHESGPQHLGQCCCGRLLWMGPQAAAVVRSHLDPSMAYDLDLGSVTLPWGEQAITALAVPLEALSAEQAKRDAGKVPTKVTDPVCRMMIDPDTAAGTSSYQGTTYYFCATVCKTRFDAEPERHVSS